MGAACAPPPRRPATEQPQPNRFAAAVRGLVDDENVPVARVRDFIAASPPPAEGSDAAAWRTWRAAVAAWHANGAGTPPLPSSDSTPAPPPSTSSKYAALLLAGPVGCWVHETAARGVTVPQLRAIYALARELCAAEGWTSAVTGDRVTAAGLNLYDLVAHLIKPATERANCSAAELVAARPQPPRLFVSHWWGEPVGDFIACLERLLKDRALPEETTNFWVCAYALRQWDLGAELRGGIGASPFERALLLADGAVSVLDRTGTYFQRAWCLLELYKSLVDSRPAFLHDIATATPWLTDRRGSVVPAVCLLDGFAERDFFFSQNKARREAPFPRELIAHSQRFALERAEASEPADLAAIVHAIGDEGAQLEATLRVRFSALDLGELLARALPAEPAQQQPQQSTPAPARVADGDVPDAGARTAERSVAVDATAKVRHALADLELSCLRKLSVSLARAHGATSADGARALARALPATLADLRLDGLPAELAERVGALVRSGQLLHVQLRHCQPRPLGDAEVVALADAASANGASVRTLDLEGNAVGADGARALAGALRASASLTTLSVKRNALGSAGARAIAAALQGQRTLLHLDLSENALDEEAKEAVLNAAYEPPDKSALERVNL
ncbi:hypothetical protein KFE25_012119 [Diacronema lutheri]|uniref:Uncharacterized protein n=1 Tax=Diacronema lutheri TaxID=2081491 RepID=A0A8J5XD97_DIALT|nr:hypothetical protein KFE25_012119 [Diacronema lutheri]